MTLLFTHDHRHDPQPYDSNYSRLLNTVIKCYTSLCKNEKARKTLNQPTKLKAEIDISAAHLNPNGEYWIWFGIRLGFLKTAPLKGRAS